MKSFVLGLFTVALLCGEDVSGTWVGRIPAGKGQLRDVAIKLVQSGGAVTGKIYGDYQSSPIVEGQVAGEGVNFLAVISEQAGNEINETRHRFTGAIKDGELELVRIREGAKKAGNGGDVTFKGESKIAFKLKRLL